MRVHNMIEVRLLQASLRHKNQELRRLFDEVVTERNLSERLALHVPADSIAARLPARPDVIADRFVGVTVLIADIIGFAELAPAVPPERLSVLLDEIFAGFDGLAKAHGLRKTKTLGNSYMATGGIPVALDDHAGRTAQLSLEMLESLEHFNVLGGHALQMRIGIATGSVVAGVIGRRMYVYDVWGDAVNAACRMESHGVAGRVQVAESTRHLLGESFVLEERSAPEAEGDGDLKTWFVTGRSRAHA
jgi:adenylate cyclase